MDSDDIFSHIRSEAAREKDRLTGQTRVRAQRTDVVGHAPSALNRKTAVRCPWRSCAFRG